MNNGDVALHQKLVSGDIPQLAYFYDGNGNMEYVGLGSWGALTSEAKWKIFKLAYDSNNNLSTVKSTHKFNILDNRTTATYG